jgi:hypothetical protein
VANFDSPDPGEFDAYDYSEYRHNEFTTGQPMYIGPNGEHDYLLSSPLSTGELHVFEALLGDEYYTIDRAGNKTIDKHNRSEALHSIGAVCVLAANVFIGAPVRAIWRRPNLRLAVAFGAALALAIASQNRANNRNDIGTDHTPEQPAAFTAQTSTTPTTHTLDFATDTHSITIEIEPHSNWQYNQPPAGTTLPDLPTAHQGE